MRISGGKLGGRVIKTPPKGVRPTQERVREALFSILGAALSDRTVLDLFAGTGALGLEAWSRGAGRVVWVEQDPPTHKILHSNVRLLCGEAVARGCVKADVFSYLRRCAERYDFILADPPYSKHTAPFDTHRYLDTVYSQGCLNPEGLLILEQRASQPVHSHPAWTVRKERKYGEARIIFYAPVT